MVGVADLCNVSLCSSLCLCFCFSSSVMSSIKKKNPSRKRKRKWNGVVPSKHRKQQQLSYPVNDFENVSCASSRKLNLDSSSQGGSSNNYFIALNFEILKELVAATSCPDCLEGEMTIVDIAKQRMGFCHLLELKCTLCDYSKRFHSSQVVENKMDVKKPKITDGTKKKKASKISINPFDINVRFVIGLREIGTVHEAMKTLSSCLNMNCLTPNGYNKIKQSVLIAYKNVAEKSMSRAASEANSLGDTTGIKQLRVSIDGSWQKRGHVSKNGVVTAVSGDKCVDVEILTKHCNGCKMWSSKKGTPEYNCWLLDHECEINHSPSSGSMESVGAVTMFKRSIEKHNVKEYLGDGDTSSFVDVTKANVYKDQNVEPIKLECVGHVQKRLGTRLRNLVKAHKGTDTPLAGKGKLTEKTINSMQNYYGNAIRSNTDNLYGMKKAVYAILFYYTNLPNISTRHVLSTWQ
ncbi:uncharacterized protein LOC130622537 [Hydractinia symbiolongicarpus]|uniref:uncharacterized protein LOC130622537 n=1 Tax=Hydractinia symbiolongicarpus TaxID=13093 RepID=UPI00254FCBE3|nr:uncharacterized protein LOC130622537 [Hydractinia symbiolongicarpus]